MPIIAPELWVRSVIALIVEGNDIKVCINEQRAIKIPCDSAQNARAQAKQMGNQLGLVQFWNSFHAMPDRIDAVAATGRVAKIWFGEREIELQFETADMASMFASSLTKKLLPIP